MIQTVHVENLFRSRTGGIARPDGHTGWGWHLGTDLWSSIPMRVATWVTLLVATAVGYALVGMLLQHLDPATGWLDLGTLSIALFAAWCCLLGAGIAGLLPAILIAIGRKGGMEKCNAINKLLVATVAFVCYIALLCVLL